MAKPSGRVEILGVPLDCVGWEQALSTVAEMVEKGGQGAFFAVNPEKVIRTQREKGLREVLARARVLVPDGIGMVFAARWLAQCRGLRRIPGSELMPAICDLSVRKGYKVYLFGSRPEVVEKAATQLKSQYPGLQIAGYRDGFAGAEDLEALVEDINASGAQILFVGLGSPRQEYWIHKNLPRLKINVCQGVGGTIDVIAGEVERAPKIIRDHHLEWLYRLVTQPHRAGRQIALLKFAYQLAKARILLWGRVSKEQTG